MALFHYCCRSGGSNLNAGTRTGSTTEPGTTADFTYASGTWVAATGVFTVASGNPSSDGVAVGDRASVYADGASETGFVGYVSARTTTTITVSLSNRIGVTPTDGTSNRTLKIGGAWQGPNGANVFPFNLVRISEGVDSSGTQRPQINLKNDQTYAITTTLSPDSNTFQVSLRGYTSSYSDGGRATIDGGTSGASFVLFSGSRAWYFYDILFQNNGATGTANLVSNAGYFFNCVFTASRGAGSSGAILIQQCEIYACNQSNTANTGGLLNPLYVSYSIIHDNTGSNNDGISVASGTLHLIGVILDSNGRDGVRISNIIANNCEFYNNGANGVGCPSGSGNAAAILNNCNFLKNSGGGLGSNGTLFNGYLFNCGFGTGTQANVSGNLSTHWQKGVTEVGSVNYATDVTPWVDPANGDFRIALAAAKGAGLGSFLQTASGYAGTIAYPDIGAAQHQDSGGGSTTHNPFVSRAFGGRR